MDSMNDDPEIVRSGLDFFQDYGWYLLIVAGGIFYLWSSVLKPYVEKIGQPRVLNQGSTETSSQPVTSNNPAEEARRQRVLRMQEEYDRKAAVEAEKRRQHEKELEEKKRLQKIEEWDNLQSGKSYYGKSRVDETTPTDTPSTLKPKKDGSSLRNNDWNPLMGGSGSGPSCSFRPGRRGPASGG